MNYSKEGVRKQETALRNGTGRRGKKFATTSFKLFLLAVLSVVILLISAGIDPVTVANRLGHKDVRVTLNTYSHALKQSDKTAAAKLNELLG